MSACPGRYLLTNLGRLEQRSRDFHRALFSTTVPAYVLDAVSANITVLRSPTCFRLEDGTFVGWEGCRNDFGCYPGSCTHVWNYAQTVAFLFPELEQSMRSVEFGLETDQQPAQEDHRHDAVGQRVAVPQLRCCQGH